MHSGDVEQQLHVSTCGCLERAPDPREGRGVRVQHEEDALRELHGPEEGRLARVGAQVRAELELVVGVRTNLRMIERNYLPI